MGVARSDPATVQDLDEVGIGVDVDGITDVARVICASGEVAAFDQHPSCAQIPQAARLAARIGAADIAAFIRGERPAHLANPNAFERK